MANVPRSYTGGRFLLNLEGVKCGFLASASGGDVTADVVLGPPLGGLLQKQLGPPRYEPLRLGLDFDLAALVYEWIAASWKQNYSRKDGSVVGTDAKLAARSEILFADAIVTETTIPALDAASKEQGRLTVVVAPGSTRVVEPKTKVPAPPKAPRPFVVSNFRLEIDGLDCTRVSKIGSFTVRHHEPGHVEVPNLTVTLSEASADSWADWHDDFVVQRHNDQAQERIGRLTLLTANRLAELARIELHNLGIFALRHPAPSGAGAVAELYCERMELIVPKP